MGVFDPFVFTQHLKLNKREIINLYRFGNKDAEGRLAFKTWMEGFRNTTGVHAMRSVPEFLKPKASRCSVHGSPWQWEETPKESLTIHKVRAWKFQHCKRKAVQGVCKASLVRQHNSFDAH